MVGRYRSNFARIQHQSSLIYHLNHRIVPKARPRLSASGRAFLPKNYRDWKTNAIECLRSQHLPPQPYQRVTIDVALFGNHRGDLDNICGAILDALVQAEILQDDRLSVVTAIAIRHYAAANFKTIITISELDNKTPDRI